MPKNKRTKKLDRKKYEEKAKERIQQYARVQKALKRAPSGYLTPAAEKLVPGNGLMSYTYTDKLMENKKKSEKTQDPEQSKEPAKEEKTATPEQEDGFLGFDDEDEDESENPLAHQFATFEKEIEEEAANEFVNGLDSVGVSGSVKIPSHHPAPWNNCVKEDTMPEKLCREIKNYVSYMSPTTREVKDRQELVSRIQGAVDFMLRGRADCKLFGSSATDMYLPQADVDMVLINKGTIFKERGVLYQLKAYFMRKGWTTDAIVVGRARVPIIKFTDSKTKLNVDISIGQSGGVEAIKVVQGWTKRQPSLKPLVMVVKQFLKKRGLSEVFHGGLGGFATICLVMSFLENHEKLKAGEINAFDNLGILLYEFFEFYGKKFDSHKLALRMTGKMPRVLKSTFGTLQTAKPEQISVEDPNDSSNNITRSSYNWVAVQKSFSHGADLLKRMMVEYNGKEDGEKCSFLGPLLKNTYDKDRHSIEVMKNKVESLAAVVTSSADGDEAKKSKREQKKAKKEKAKRKEEKNRKAKSSAEDTQTTPKRSHSVVDLTADSSSNSIIDLTQDDPSPKRRASKAIAEVFQAASSSDSEIETTSVKKAVKKKKKNQQADSSEDEVSRTKMAGPGATERKRAFWAKKNGLES